MEGSSSDKQGNEQPVIVHVNNAKNVYKKLQNEMKEVTPAGLEDEDIIKLRRRLVYECEKTFGDPEWQTKMFQLLWSSAFYGTIFVYRGAWKLNQGLKAGEKEAYQKFVEKTKSYLLRLCKSHPDLSYHIFNAIGDIHRYSAEILKNPAEVKNAIKYYGYATKADPSQGHPFNQLGLLLRNDFPWKAIIMFLRAGLTDEPYSRALENVNLLKSEQWDEKLQECSMDYILEMFNPFNRLLLDNPKNIWNAHLKAEIEEDSPDYKGILEAFAVVVLGSMNAIADDDRGNDERQRYLIAAISDDFKLLFKEFADAKRNSPVDERIKQRFREVRARRKAEEDDEEYKLFSEDEEESEEDDDEDSESEEVNNSLDPTLPLLALLIEWYHFVDLQYSAKRSSVAVRMILQTISILIRDTTNKYIDHLQVATNSASDSAKVVWTLKTPGTTLPESFFHKLIPVLLKPAEKWSSFPIYFDRYYKLLGKSQEMSTMREMARLQLEHSTTDETNTFLPEYYLLEADVLRTRLYVVKALQNDKANLLVSKSTMRRFDKLKTLDQDARTAVRYLEEKTKCGEIKLLNEDYDQSFQAARAFLATLENFATTSILILCAGNEPIYKYDNTVISKEGVDKFFTRYSALKRRN